MCLVRSNIFCGPRYAIKDIICYKVLRKGLFGETFDGIYYSPYKFFRYKLKERVSSNFSFTLSTSTSFLPQEEYNRLKSLENFNCVTQGLHSFKYLSAAIGHNIRFVGGVVVECIIPKGSWYYEGTGNELVSDNIIINKELII